MSKVSCKTIVFVLMLLFVTLNISSAAKIKQIDQSITSTAVSNDEIGGSLLDVMSQDSSKIDQSLFMNEVPPKVLFDPFVDENAIKEEEKAKAKKAKIAEEAEATSSQPLPTLNEAPSTNTNSAPQVQRDQSTKSRVLRNTNSIINNMNRPIIIQEAGEKCEPADYSKLHTPYGEENTDEKRKITIISRIIFGFVFLSIRLILSVIPTGKDKFYSKSLKTLSNQMMLYFILVSLVQVLYTYGALDVYQINWQFFITSLYVFGAVWFVFGAVVGFLCYLIVLKWEFLEEKAISFEQLRNRYSKRLNQLHERMASNINAKIDNSDIFEQFEYLAMKTYFIVPNFPVYKPSILRKNFNFAKYLNYCLRDSLELFYKISWTCWFILIVLLLLWNRVILPLSIPALTSILAVMPLVGVALTFGIYLYLGRVQRKIVSPIDDDSPNLFRDLNPNTQASSLENLHFAPKYIENLTLDNKLADVSPHNLYSHLHNRTPSFYEDNIIMGSTGLYFILNLTQTLSISLIIFQLVIFSNKFHEMSNYYSVGMILGIFIPLALFYIAAQIFLCSVNIKWFSIFANIEMRKNERNVSKVIDKQTIAASKMAESIFKSFKLLFLQYKITENKEFNKEYSPEEFVFRELTLAKINMQQLVDLSIKRFKFIGDEESYLTKDKYEIDIDRELKQFLKSSGCHLDQSDISFMLHFIDSDDGKITKNQFFNIWAYMIIFSNTPPEVIFYTVMEGYFTDNKQSEKIRNKTDKRLTKAKLEDILQWFGDFLNKEQKKFILEEIAEDLGESFSIDALVYTLTSMRRYHYS